MAIFKYMSRKEKLAYLKSLGNVAIRAVSENAAAWRRFLRFYANFYKYSFSEATLIQAQAPGAKYIEREGRIIDVISNNSEIIAGLKTTLEISHAAHATSLARIHERIDGLNNIAGAINNTLTKAVATVDEIVRRQQSNADDIKKVLLWVDNAPGEGWSMKSGEH